jgi:hypothetical protein
MKILGLVYGKDGTQKQKIHKQMSTWKQTVPYTKRLVHRKASTRKGRYTERLVHATWKDWYTERYMERLYTERLVHGKTGTQN